jgi:hypothetical protein
VDYLDFDRLDAVDGTAFRRREPYPWLNPRGLITDDGLRALRGSLPDLSLFEACFDKARKYGQRSHDRYILEWHPGLELPEPWQEFLAEVRGERYRSFLERVLGITAFRLRFHWHYTPRGCAVWPHCDAKRKLGSHIFYLNTSEDWDPRWGGETLILDDGGRFHSDSHPAFEDFVTVESAAAIDNHSLLFLRNGDSWHGVREITAPEGRLRRVFIVVFEKTGLVQDVLRTLAPLTRPRRPRTRGEPSVRG